MTHKDQRILLTRLVSSLVLWAADRGWDLAFDEGMVKSPRSVWFGGNRVVLPDAVHKHGSFHHRGLAIDLLLYIGGEYIIDGDCQEWKEIATKWESLHPLATSGRRWNDANHLSIGEGKKEGGLPA